MGFSVSGAAAVIFIGLLVSAATLYPAVDRYTERRSEAMDAKNERALAQQNTAVEPINATYNTTTGDLNVTVENTGATTLTVPAVDLLADGEYVPLGGNTSVDGDGTTDLWAPGEGLRITVERGTAPDRIKLVSGPGVAVTTAVEVV
jgi:flagellar protein FlaF